MTAEPAWVCPDDHTPLNRGDWDKMTVDVYTNEARFSFRCPHGGHPVEVIRDTKGSVAYKVRSYAPAKMVVPAQVPPEVQPGIVIRVGKRRKK